MLQTRAGVFRPVLHLFVCGFVCALLLAPFLTCRSSASPSTIIGWGGRWRRGRGDAAVQRAALSSLDAASLLSLLRGIRFPPSKQKKRHSRAHCISVQSRLFSFCAGVRRRRSCHVARLSPAFPLRPCPHSFFFLSPEQPSVTVAGVVWCLCGVWCVCVCGGCCGEGAARTHAVWLFFFRGRCASSSWSDAPAPLPGVRGCGLASACFPFLSSAPLLPSQRLISSPRHRCA